MQKKTWALSLIINWSYTTHFKDKNHEHKYIQVAHLQHEVQRHKNIQATKDNGNFNNWQHSLQRGKNHKLVQCMKIY